MSGAQNDSNGHNGSPPHTNGNGDTSAATTLVNGNGNGHGYPSSGSSSPTSSHVEARNIAILDKLNIPVGTAEMAYKYGKGTLFPGEVQIELITNAYGLRHSLKLHIHSFHMVLAKITLSGKFPIVFKKRFIPDYLAVTRRRLYEEVMPLFCLKDHVFFGDNMNDHLFDYGHTLFSLRDLKFDKNADGKLEKFLELSPEEAKDVTYNAGLSLSLRPSNIDFLVQNFDGVCRDLDSYDASIFRFTELATSHHVAHNFKDNCMFSNNKTYFLNPSMHGFSPNDCPDLGNGKFLAVGAEKSILLIEGSDSVNGDNDSLPAVVIDCKKTPFYKDVLLVDVICETLRIERNEPMTEVQINSLQPLFRRLTCHRTYGKTSSALVMRRLTNVPASQQTMVSEEHGTETLEQYFLRRYNIALECPNWPVAEMRVRESVIYFPIELLEIAKYQRVKFGMLGSNDIQKIIKYCAVPPYKKREEIQQCHGAFNINADAFCQNAGISVMSKPLKAVGRILAPPQIIYENGQVNPTSDGRWTVPSGSKYISKSSCRNWLAVLIDYPYPRSFDLEMFANFCQQYREECNIRGVEFAEPHDIVKVAANDKAIDKLFADACLAGMEFILFGHPDEEIVLHDHLKTFERKFMIVTQCVRTSTIDKVVNGQSKLTMENIIAKSNVKLGGHNYSTILKDYAIDPKTLFIGLGVNHPGGGFGSNVQQQANTEGAVSILGYSANDSNIPGSFVGNFFVQKLYQDDQLTVLNELMEEVLARFVKNRGFPPSRVIIYRSGCSQGQYERVLKYEMPIYLHFVKKYSPQAPVTLIVPSKLHNVRFFKKDINPADRPPAQNIPPGTVIDNTVVHSKFMEFYLNSHVALQGTAKTPRYTILFTSEKAATLDLFQRWTNALCYNYQIVNSPVSIPAPVYIADCYAKRGRQIANNFVLTKVSAGQESMGLEISAEVRPDEDKHEFVKISYRYNFSHRPGLRERRVNA